MLSSFFVLFLISSFLSFQHIMPPNPSPVTQSSGSCVVCGRKTWMRCSACSENGLDWMCFCSREHQKLVSRLSLPFFSQYIILIICKSQIWQIWFMHKRVCGRNSNPFRWPKFNDDEIADQSLISSLSRQSPFTPMIHRRRPASWKVLEKVSGPIAVNLSPKRLSQ